MEGEELRQGKERVRLYLTDALKQTGLERKRGVTVKDHEAMLNNLQARLAYMSKENLQALAETVGVYAGGPLKNIWPAEVSICNWARRIQRPPAGQSRLVRSYLQSGAGDLAKSSGYLVELFDHLRKFGAPPNSYSLEAIREEAERNRRRRKEIMRDRERGRASPSEEEWVHSYMTRRLRCLDIIKAKEERAVA